MSNQELAAKLDDCTIDPSEFNHRAHLQICYFYLQNLGPDQTIELLKTQLLRLVKHLGIESKFDAELTQKSVILMDKCMAKTPTNNFEEFINIYPTLLSHFKEHLENL